MEYIPKQEQYKLIGLSTLLLLPVIIIYRAMVWVLFGLGFGWPEIFIYLAPLFISAGAYIAPFYYENKAYREVSDLIFYYNYVVGYKKLSNKPLLLAAKDIFRIEIDWEDATSLKKRLTSDQYNTYKELYIKQQIIRNLSDKRGKSQRNHLNLLGKINEYIETLQDPQKNLDQESLEKLSKMVANETEQEHIDLDDLVSSTNFALDHLTEESEFMKKYRETLSNFVLYYVILNEPKLLPDEEEEWEKVLFITDDKSANLLETHKANGMYNRWLIKYRRCRMTSVYWRKIVKGYPFLYIDWTENQSINKSKTIQKLNKESNAYLQLRVDDVWMNQIISEPESLKRDLEHFRGKAIALEQDLSNIVQDLANTSIIYGDFMANKRQEELKNEIRKYQKRSWIFLATIFGILGLFIAIIALIV
jgi:hypothetical protein